MSALASFKQSDVERACRALKAVGEQVGGVDILPDGTVRVLTRAEVEQQAPDEFAAWEREDGHRAA